MTPTRLLLIAAAMILLVVVGCEGPSGPAGSQGVPGPPGSATSTEQDTLGVTVTSVTIASNPVVNFVVTDQSGLPVANLADLVAASSNTVRMTLAKLIPASGGNASYWQSYKNNLRTSGAVKTMAANYDSGGTFVYHGSGSYTYTFTYDPATAVYPAFTSQDPHDGSQGNLIGYDASLVHRVGIQISGQGLPATNATYDFIPNGTTYDAATMGRDVVKTASCNECHNKLTLHGSRTETRYCVTCHNPGTTDAAASDPFGKLNTADFKVMIHKIHRSKSLPSVDGGGTYEIGGHDFSEIGFPQDIRNCTKCHDGANTTQGNNWYTQPTKEACSSCHDDVNLVTGTGHPVGAKANGTCALCHDSSLNPINLAADYAPIRTAHLIPEDKYAPLFKYEFVGTPSYNSGTGILTAVLKVTSLDPNVTGAYDLSSQQGGTVSQAFNLATVNGNAGGAESAASLSLLIGWNTSDYSNEGSGSSPGQPLSVNLLSDSSYTGGTVTENGDGTYTVAVNLSSTGISASGVVALQGHPAAWDTNTNEYVTTDGALATNTPSNNIVRVPVKSVVTYFSTDGGTPEQRRQVVNITAKCDKCHKTLAMHGANRVDEGQICVICHNPFATDINRRPSTGVGDDGKVEEAIDFKRLIHGIHSQGSTKRQQELLVYGFGGSKNHFDETEIHFPGRVSDCTTCHEGTSYTLPLGQDVFGSTVESVAYATDLYQTKSHTFNSVAVTAGTDTIAIAGHKYENSTTAFGVAVQVKPPSGGTLPSPLAAATNYYVVGSVASTSIKLAATPGGSAVDILDAGNDNSSNFTIFAPGTSTGDDDLKFSRTASVCSACHDSVTATSHMSQNGGSVEIRNDDPNSAVYGMGELIFTNTKTIDQQSAAPAEACPLCHGPGRFADITVWHVVTPD
jgi:OmcA/MtrC family decaheme c-type cytochrome